MFGATFIAEISTIIAARGRLTGKAAIVTGAASGIGEACARLFAAEGATVLLTDLEVDRGEAVASGIGQPFLKHDVANEADWLAVIDAALKRFGRLDVLVNNAGLFLSQSIEESDLDDWNRVLAVNLTGTMLGCKHAIAAMKQNPDGPQGSIINMSSMRAFFGAPRGAAYTASKGGVRLLSKSVAVHCAREYRTIRCNSLHPGTIDTPIVARAIASAADPDAARASLEAQQPIGRMATPAEVAEAALFLASDHSAYVIGAELVVDGGWLAAGGG